MPIESLIGAALLAAITACAVVLVAACIAAALAD